jgi:hypothetical protein
VLGTASLRAEGHSTVRWSGIGPRRAWPLSIVRPGTGAVSRDMTISMIALTFSQA